MRHLPFFSSLFTSLVQGHYTFGKVVLNGANVGGDFEYIRTHENGRNPLYDSWGALNSTDLRCNIGAKPNNETKILSVTAGDKLGFQLAWGDIIDHPGPGLIYISKAPENDVAMYDGSGDWFKVYETGFCVRDGRTTPEPWRDWCLQNSDTIEFIIPKTLPPGQYLARPEMLALQYAFSKDVQIYTGCAQLSVEGPGGGTPGPMVKIPGLYTDNEPGFNYDTRETNLPRPFIPYIIPGPRLWTE